MKVLHLVPTMHKSSGVTTFCSESCDAIKRLGCECSVAIQRESEPYPSKCGVERLLDSEAYRRFASREWNVLHIHGIWPPFFHKYVKCAYELNIPIVWSIHGMLSVEAMRYKRWKKILPWYIYQKSDLMKAAVIHVTAWNEKQRVEELGFKQPISVIPLGASYEVNRKETVKKDNVVLFVGRIHPIKGLDNLIRAWAILKRKDWRLRIVGPDRIGYGEELWKLSNELDIAESVEFAGAKYEEELELEYRRAKVFVLPSKSENFGGVVIDALSCGTPVIATKGTPWNELATRQCGLWIDYGVEPLVDALRKMVDVEDDKRLKMRDSGFEFVKEKYSWSAIGANLIDIYKKVCRCNEANGRPE